MNKALFAALDMLESEKGIPKAYMFEKLEAALVSAYRREMGGSTNVRVQINEEKYDFKVFKRLDIVEEVTDSSTQISLADAKKMSRRHVLGGVVEIEVKPDEFRRLSAITGKQVIVQAIREAERGIIYKEYEEKKEEIVSAVVDKVDPETGNVRLVIGNSTVTLLKSEQIPGETFEPGQHVKVYVIEVKKEANGRPYVTISRTHSGLVKRLFELNIPEIADGTLVIMNVAREAGSRTKVSIMSRDPNVDPIGTCVGPQNQRKAVVTDELSGEKIDIIRFSEQPEEYVKAALAPADIANVEMDGERSCKVYVNADQLSLAIGKEGQNARLAARLTGIKIDIKSAE
jgi:N utilization substance protein A